MCIFCAFPSSAMMLFFRLKNHKPSAVLLLLILLTVCPGGDGKEVVSWVNLKAALGLSGNDGNNKTTALVLAADRTRRKDPTAGLGYYSGGWNTSNPHYIASVLFTGFPLFAIAAVWLIAFGMFLLVTFVRSCCCPPRRPKVYASSKFSYVLSLVLLVLFTLAAIVGSIVLYTGEDKFHDSTRSTLNFIVSQADSTVHNLRYVSVYLTNAKRVGVEQSFLPQQVQNNVDKVNTMISSAADFLGHTTSHNKDKIFHIHDTVRVVLIVVASVMLALAFFGFLLSISGLQCPVYVLIVIGWVLVTLTFIICGIFLVLHNVTGDTCVAMNEWVVNPTAHTALDDIIPCVDTAVAQKALSNSKEVTYGIVYLVDTFIRNISNANLPPNLPTNLPFQFRAFLFNQSGPSMPLLCNPYNPDLTNRTCAPGEVNLGNATQVWKKYVCQVSDHQCTTVGRLTPDRYSQINGAVAIAYGLHHYGPFLTNLVDCTFLRDTFTTIHNDHCPKLERYSKWVYIGLAIVSAAVMLSLILWVLYTQESRHRKYTKIGESSGRTSSLDSKSP